MHDDELSTLLLAARPRPRESFAAELDARAAARFPPRARPRAARPSRWAAWRQRPFLPAAATALAVGLVALVVALSAGGDPSMTGGSVAPDTPSPASGGVTSGDAAGGGMRELAPQRAAADDAASAPKSESFAHLSPPVAGRFDSARKVERTAALELGTDADRVDAVAQGVLGVVARFDGIVDQSSVQSGADGGEASFELRIPAARLQPALVALSRLPDAHVLSRTDDAVDVNQAYVSVRRRLANARAERAGVVRALANADTEDETLRLRARLDQLEHTIAQGERAQRALDRRVDYSRVSVGIRSTHRGAGGVVPADDGSFGIGDAAHDALRVLEVAGGVIVIAAAALVPVAVLAALAWPLARALSRRRREQALDAA
jgi:hypothetical protein